MERRFSLDLFRAIIVVLFVFYNMLGTFTAQENIPFVLKHNQHNILLFGDLIAPSFAFVLGASLFYSFQNRFKEFGTQAALRYAKRFALLALLGFLLDGALCESLFGFCVKWGILQGLGIAGIVATAFLALRDWKVKILAGLALLAAYSYAIYGSTPTLGFEGMIIHGGVVGGIGYGIIAVFGAVCAQLAIGKKWEFAAGVGVIFVIAAYAASAYVPFDKWTASPSYVLLSSGIAMLAWAGLDAAVGKGKKEADGIVNVLGRNSLTFWILQYALVWYPMKFTDLWGQFKFDGGVIFSLILLVVFYFLTERLGRMSIRLSF